MVRPPDGGPVGKRRREVPESAGPTLSRESEVVIVPVNLGTTGGREGPLLSSRVPRWERLLDCPREGRLNPSARRPRPKHRSDWTQPANSNGRSTVQPSANPIGGSRFSTTRCVDATSSPRPGGVCKPTKALQGSIGWTSRRSRRMGKDGFWTRLRRLCAPSTTGRRRSVGSTFPKPGHRARRAR